jgi:coenzyme F420 hydrogenase subunit beta
MIFVEIENIQEISNYRLCVGCGTCAVICPTNAIETCLNDRGFYEAVVDKSKCVACKLCLEVCPSYILDFDEMNVFVFNRHAPDSLIGNYRCFYLGHAKDSSIHQSGQSGGLITALLGFALDKGFIDAAIVTRMGKQDPLRPEVIIAKNKEELLSATRSKYCPAPVNARLKEILKKDAKYAIVQLPCQMIGLRKLESLIPELKEKIVLRMGLFCSHVLSLKVIDFLSQKAGVLKEDVTKFDYRAKEWRGWPGDVLFELRNKRTKFLTRDYRGVTKPFFTPWRCKMCYDHVNEFADISFGDAWLPGVIKHREGETIVIARTERGEALIRKAKEEMVVEIQEVSRAILLQAQKSSIMRKKNWLSAHLLVAKLFGEAVPHYTLDNPKPTKLKIIRSICEYFDSQIPHSRFPYFFLRNLPLPLLRLYVRAISFRLER